MSSETVQKTLEALGKRKDGGLFGTGSDEPTLPTQEPYIKALIKSLPLSQSGTKGTSLDQIEGEIEKTTFVLETAQPTLADAALFLALHPVLVCLLPIPSYTIILKGSQGRDADGRPSSLS